MTRWRCPVSNKVHLSLAQRRVMTAIEICRTAALGGHVERCEDCAHTRIAYRSGYFGSALMRQQLSQGDSRISTCFDETDQAISAKPNPQGDRSRFESRDL